MDTPRAPLGSGIRALLAVGWALAAAFLLHGLVPIGGTAAASAFELGVYHLVLVIAVAAVFARAIRVRRERSVWMLLACAFALWTAGDVYYAVNERLELSVSVPSPADAGWLGYYPLTYLALLLLARARLSGLRRGMWLDGIVAALAMGAVAAVVMVQVVVQGGGITSSLPETVTNLAYPLADLVLLAVATLIGALYGWRMGGTWLLLAVAFLSFAVADAVFLYEVYRGVYVGGGPLDALWLVSGLLTAHAAVSQSPAQRPARGDGHRMLVMPAASGAVALGMLVLGTVVELNPVAITLATLCLLCVIARMVLTFAESRREALTDALTGLPNRRQLTRDLAECAAHARPERPSGLVLLDLNGFKTYNDRFGHPAGDALLARLGQRLADAVRGEGTAYRMGGDEFCVLLTPRTGSVENRSARVAAALSEQGEAFSISAAYGLVVLPGDATDADRALRLADERMYRAKQGDRAPAGHEAGAALLQVLAERLPGLGDHKGGVAELAAATGRRLGIAEDRLTVLDLAARLHDVGKIAIPDEILSKLGPLTDEEWEIMRRHPVIGERVVGAAPALAPVAPIVRSSHERVDGAGYPDGLRGGEIPLEARIIAVCDAFDAIIGERPYAARQTPGEAAEELRRCAGTQFDPDVVDAFLAELRARAADPTLAAATA